MVNANRGFLEVPKGMIAWIEVHEKDSREIFYEPTYEDIEKICVQYDFPFEETLKIVRERRPDAQGFLFVAEEYRKYCLEDSIVHFYYDLNIPGLPPLCKDVNRQEWVRFDQSAVGDICTDCQFRLHRRITDP